MSKSVCFSVFALLLLSCHVLAQDDFGENAPDSREDLSLPVPKINGVRLRCTDQHLKLYHNATTCHDERTAESCKMIFGQQYSSNPANRDPKCDDPLLQDLARQCQKSCAICCEDPNYACENDDSGIVNCELNVEKCGQKDFTAMMTKYCPATCGLCQARKCRDQIDDCLSMKTLCGNDLYSVFMEQQCAKTCGKCSTSSGSTKEEEGSEELPVDPEIESLPEVIPEVPSGKKCADVMKHCAKNKKFCRHASYLELMKKNCAKTCGYCDEPKKKSRGGFAGISGSKGKTGSARRADCKDKHEFCKSWVKNGFCNSHEYSEDYKRETCAKSCNLC